MPEDKKSKNMAVDKSESFGNSHNQCYVRFVCDLLKRMSCQSTTLHNYFDYNISHEKFRECVQFRVFSVYEYPFQSEL